MNRLPSTCGVHHISDWEEMEFNRRCKFARRVDDFEWPANINRSAAHVPMSVQTDDLARVWYHLHLDACMIQPRIE